MNAMQKHLAAIKAGQVTKTNVIGLRKAVNHVERLRQGWSGNRCAATAEQVAEAMEALEARKPIVRGELHASGVRLITDKRYRKRLEPVAAQIAGLQGFSLVGFHEITRTHSVPIYLAWGNRGSFRFYAIPWQTAFAFGLESGPQLLEG